MSEFRAIILLVLLLIAFIFTFGVLTSMITDGMGQMSGCPFANGEAFCRMGVFEHLVRFQRAFTGIPVKMMVFLLAVSLIWSLIDNEVTVFPWRGRSSYLKSIRGPDPSVNVFLLALSDGIVQPKLYT